MQQSRFELKYLISEETALRVRDFLQTYIHMGYIDVDEYSVGKPNLSYPVHSLYLDSRDLNTYWDTINGNKNRFKLRIRYYDDAPGTPVFFEIKRRMDHCILKQRGGVRKEVVPWLLSGHQPEPSHLLSKAEKQYVALNRFHYLMQQLGATPKVHIAYLREAYVSANDSFRVTIDRDVRAEANLEGIIKTHMTNPVPSFVGEVILELKFTDRFPNWYRDLVRVINVMQCGAAKYVESVQGIGHRALDALRPVVEESAPHLSTPGAPDFRSEHSTTFRVPNWVRDQQGASTLD